MRRTQQPQKSQSRDEEVAQERVTMKKVSKQTTMAESPQHDLKEEWPRGMRAGRGEHNRKRPASGHPERKERQEEGGRRQQKTSLKKKQMQRRRRETMKKEWKKKKKQKSKRQKKRKQRLDDEKRQQKERRRSQERKHRREGQDHSHDDAPTSSD